MLQIYDTEVLDRYTKMLQILYRDAELLYKVLQYYTEVLGHYTKMLQILYRVMASVEILDLYQIAKYAYKTPYVYSHLDAVFGSVWGPSTGTSNLVINAPVLPLEQVEVLKPRLGGNLPQG
jgi:hypothetical protein